MANFLRTDRMPEPKQASGRGPIVLARIPHASANDVRMILPLTSAGNADLVVADEPPSINMPTTGVSTVPLTSEFVDHRHVANEAPPTPKREPAGGSSRSSHTRSHSSEAPLGSSHTSQPVKSFGHASRSAPKANRLHRLHSQVAPHSGAIVALALLLSAGLLYWMIAAPNGEPTDFRGANYGSFEASTAELPSFTPKASGFMSEGDLVGEHENIVMDEYEALVEDLPWWETEEVKIDGPKIALEETLPPLPGVEEQKVGIEDLMPIFEMPEAVSEPTPESVMANLPEPTFSPSTGLAFPSTNRPAAIDFSKFNAAPASEPQSVPAQQKPAVKMGKRPLSRILTPIKG